AEIDEHDVLGAVLLRSEQALRVALPAERRPRDRVDARASALGPDECLGRGADQREVVAELQEEEIRRRVNTAKRAVELDRAGGGRPLGALREHDLERVARADVLLRDADDALVLVPRGSAAKRPGDGAVA